MARNCPVCGEVPRRIKTPYGVKRECCGLWAWGNKPLVGALTHEARKRAHAAFDQLWQDGHLSRSEAYRRLAKVMGLSPGECHMAQMDAVTARRVPAAVEIILAELFPEGTS